MDFELDLKPIEDIVERHGRAADAAIPILQAIQHEYRYLPEAALRRVCELTQITPAALESISSFFPQFRRKPAGKHSVCVCDGTACHLKGAPDIFEALTAELGIAENEDTDSAGVFTVQRVRCLGCCTLAPAVQIDGVTYGHVRKEQVPQLLADFLAHADEAKQSADAADATPNPAAAEIRIGLGSCCVAGGSERVRVAVSDAIKRHRIAARIKRVSCVGMCHQTPLMEILIPGQPSKTYARLDPEDAVAIVLSHFPPRAVSRIRARAWKACETLYTGKTVAGAADRMLGPSAAAFAAPQTHIATELCGQLDPLDLDEWKRHGAFTALSRCLGIDGAPALEPQAIIDEIERSGLRGRGGAGFATARKWREAARTSALDKYIICNGDEGDPGAFMDRMLLESYPFRVIEGMLIASLAVGAHRGIFYIRAEYPLAVARVRSAIEMCIKVGIIGDHVLGSNHACTIEVREGAGAFVCGEESALIAALEGTRPVPRYRPPYPVHQGLHGCPTLVNNVETFSLVPWIFRNGPDAFAALGAAGSKGTKVFSLAGKIQRGGLIEVPMGATIRQLVEEIGGGVPEGRTFKAVQIGGPSGGCIPAAMADIPVDFEALTDAGAMMGSGGLVVLDDTDCMLEMCRYFLSFTQLESCGKCTPCRVGTSQMLEILGRLCEGAAHANDIQRLEQLAHVVKTTSLCGLGRTAPNPVLTTLRYFREEFDAHVAGHCPAHKCKALFRYRIDETCTGCTKCAQVCPTDAIAMKPYEVHEIDQTLCIKCGGCFDICPVRAVKAE
jgi:NADH:ubiquinone oxidoreductase subunit F (NADH-binding)/NADH:ubiquinone oxidoreductase subunit E/Pyruvate/2-oxoacid:ferredoxin oxidoreductase delta subunit